MITDFEELTTDLTDDELAMLPVVVSVLGQTSEQNPLKAPLIVSKVQLALDKNKMDAVFNERKLRKFVNHIRCTGALPLIATANGYFVTDDVEVIKRQIKSLGERARSIQMCADGLLRLLEVHK